MGTQGEDRMVEKVRNTSIRQRLRWVHALTPAASNHMGKYLRPKYDSNGRVEAMLESTTNSMGGCTLILEN